MNFFGHNKGLLNGATPWEVHDVKSSRTDTYNPDTGKFTTNIGDDMGSDDVGHTYQVSSSAIDSARYDPSDNSLNITYRNGSKEYKFEATPQEASEWLMSPSKGRLTQQWRYTNRYPGY